MARGKSRPKRWDEACAKIRDGLSELVDLKDEYEDWRDNLPEGLDQGTLAEKLDEVIEADLDSIESILDEVQAMDLPRGFGRD